MIESDDNVATALKLEEIRLLQVLAEASRTRGSEISALHSRLAAKGLFNSGARFKGELDIVFASLQEVLTKTIAHRKELSIKVPELLSPSSLEEFQSQLNRCIDGAVKGIGMRSKLPPGNLVTGAVKSEAERRVQALKARISQELQAMPLEANLGLHREGEQNVTTFNISNSTIAGLNLGNVIGDLNSSIQHLNTEGHTALGGEVAKLTEAVAASTELDDGARKEVLEHLAVVTAEAAKPTEQRRMGPLKTSVEAIRSAILVGTQMVTLWQGVEHALKSAGISFPYLTP